MSGGTEPTRPVPTRDGPRPGKTGRIGFFGAFYPMTARAGGASTGMALLLAESPRLEGVVVFGPGGSTLPPGADPAHLEVIPAWEPDDLRRLLHALKEMTRRGTKVDGYLFSIYVTAFGKRSLVNAAGLVLPVVVGGLTKKPVVVFMHNFVETQDVEALGYRPSPIALRLARFLERLLVDRTVTVVGLESQKRIVESTVGGTVRFVPMRFTEAVHSWMSRPHAPPPRAPRDGSEPLRVLLFGSWGPQKDLEGALMSLDQLRNGGTSMQVTVAGGANPNFPDEVHRIEELRQRLPPEHFRFLGPVPESEVHVLFEGNDVLLLPYNASGGYSGVMNVAAGYGLPIISYDLPQLRECAELLHAEAHFVPPRDPRAIGNVLGTLRPRTVPSATGGTAPEPPGLVVARQSIEALVQLFEGADPP